MKLYLLSQTENGGYDTFDSIVVAAKSEKDARQIHPRLEYFTEEDIEWEMSFSAWASSPSKVKVKLIGTAIAGTKRGVIISSFNAG